MIFTKLILMLANLVELYNLMVLLYVLLEMFINLDIFNRYNKIVAKAYVFFGSVTEPVFEKIREYVPSIGGLDISPAILMIILECIKALLLSML